MDPHVTERGIHYNEKYEAEANLPNLMKSTPVDWMRISREVSGSLLTHPYM